MIRHEIKVPVSHELAETIRMAETVGLIYSVELHAETCGGYYVAVVFVRPDVVATDDAVESQRLAGVEVAA